MQESQTFLPISNQRFGWWLFLSANMMMFAGLIGASFVLRSGVPANEWPEPSWVKSHWCIGMVTIVLLVFVCWCLWNEQRGRAGSLEETVDESNRFPWVACALGFAVFSVSIIGLDCQNKIKLGLFPNRARPAVHGEADLHYLSSVSTAANERIAALEQLPNPDSQTKQKLNQWRLIQSGLVDWTRRKIGRTDDPTMKTLSLDQLANQIYRTRPDPRLKKFTRDETAEINLRLDSAQANVNDLNNIENLDAGAIASLQESIDQDQQRLAYLEAVSDEKNPIRELMNGTLPKVIPGGPTWIANYWLLTGFLSVQLLMGTCLLIVSVFSNRRPASTARSDTLQNVTEFWYFVAGMGIIMSSFVWIF